MFRLDCLFAVCLLSCLACFNTLCVNSAMYAAKLVNCLLCVALCSLTAKFNSLIYRMCY